MNDLTPHYHKIQSVFKRDSDNHYKTFIMDDWSEPEFVYLADLEWQATEKVDGTNCRIHIFNEPAMARTGFQVGGRTGNSQLHVDLVNEMNEIGEHAIHNLELEGLTLYGEGYGEGIQKGGGDYRPDKGFILFDVMVTETGVFLERENVMDIAEQLGVGHVSVVWSGSLTMAVEKFAHHDHCKSVLRDTEAEGWVLRPTTELRGRLGQRVITKIKVKDFPDERIQS